MAADLQTLVSQLTALCEQLQSSLSVSQQVPAVQPDPVQEAQKELTKGISKDDARELFRQIGSAGCYTLPILRHLHSAFGLTKKNAQANDNVALRWAAKNGHLEVLKCLKEYFGLGKEDAQAHDNFALRCAAGNGYVGVLKYLKEEFGLGKEDAQADDNFALRTAAANGHVEVLKCLKDEFGLGKEDATVAYNYTLFSSTKRRLSEFFGLGFDVTPKQQPQEPTKLTIEDIVAHLKRKFDAVE